MARKDDNSDYQQGTNTQQSGGEGLVMYTRSSNMSNKKFDEDDCMSQEENKMTPSSRLSPHQEIPSTNVKSKKYSVDESQLRQQDFMKKAQLIEMAMDKFINSSSHRG